MTAAALSYAAYLALVDDAASVAQLAAEQARALRNVAASWAMDDMPLTADELRLGAEMMAGRIDFSAARRHLNV